MVRDASSEDAPFPKFGSNTLVVEAPEILECTYRTAKKLWFFQLPSPGPGTLLRNEKAIFAYQYFKEDNLSRNIKAKVAIIGKKIYMIYFGASLTELLR